MAQSDPKRKRPTAAKAAAREASAPTKKRRASSKRRARSVQPALAERFWLDSDITSDEDVQRDTFGASRLAELNSG